MPLGMATIHMIMATITLTMVTPTRSCNLLFWPGPSSPRSALLSLKFLAGFSAALSPCLNDAVHNLSDVPALGLSWLAMRWAQRPADSDRTYGYHRAGTLAAFTNAVVLVFLSLWLAYEAIERLRSPVQAIESWMIWTSVAALCVNGGITLALVRGRSRLEPAQYSCSQLWRRPFEYCHHCRRAHHGLYLRTVDRSDSGSCHRILVLYSSIGILRESTHILLEGRPRGVHVDEVAHAIFTVEHVQEVHDVHIWSLGGGHNASQLSRASP